MIGLLGALLLCGPAQAQQDSCLEDVPGQYQITLYLGRDKPTGGKVSRRAWRRFQREEVAPRLPGYTTLRARGVWTDNGSMVLERTWVLVWVGEQSQALPLLEVAEAYRERFDQSAVMLTGQDIDLSFVTACDGEP